MVAATVTTRLDTHDPTREDVLLTAGDSQTYTSRKFPTVVAGQATINEDAGSLSIPVSVAVSGNTVTIHCTGLSAQKVLLTLMGRK